MQLKATQDLICKHSMFFSSSPPLTLEVNNFFFVVCPVSCRKMTGVVQEKKNDMQKSETEQKTEWKKAASNGHSTSER